MCVKENKNKRINPKKSDRHKTDNACSEKKNAVQHKKSEKKKKFQSTKAPILFVTSSETRESDNINNAWKLKREGFVQLIPDSSLPDTWYYFANVRFSLRKKKQKQNNM